MLHGEILPHIMTQSVPGAKLYGALASGASTRGRGTANAGSKREGAYQHAAVGTQTYALSYGFCYERVTNPVVPAS